MTGESNSDMDNGEETKPACLRSSDSIEKDDYDVKPRCLGSVSSDILTENVSGIDCRISSTATNDTFETNHRNIGNEEYKCQSTTDRDVGTSVIPERNDKTRSQNVTSTNSGDIRSRTFQQAAVERHLKEESKLKTVRHSPYSFFNISIGTNRMVRCRHGQGQTNKLCVKKEANVINIKRFLSTTNEEMNCSKVEMASQIFKPFTCQDVNKKFNASDEKDYTNSLLPVTSYFRENTIFFRQVTVCMLRVQHEYPQAPDETVRGLESEWNRVATFSSFQAPQGIFVVRLASNGFYLPNTADIPMDQVKLKCAFCGIEVPVLQFSGKHAADVHRQFSPNCSFLLGESVGNVLISDSTRALNAQLMNEYFPNQGPGHDSSSRPTTMPFQSARVAVTGRDSSAHEDHPSIIPSGQRTGSEAGSGGSSSANGTERQAVTYEDLGIYAGRPKYQEKAVLQIRVNSFESWPHNASHPPGQMASAGFYFTGRADLVRCFYCGGGLKSWESTDNPWVEHSRWFPRCTFIKLCKGKKFTEAVRRLNDSGTRMISENDVYREMKRMNEQTRNGESRTASNLQDSSNVSDQDRSNEMEAQAVLHEDAEATGTSMDDLRTSLESENERLRNPILCKICQSDQVNVLFLPCGHLIACAQTCAMCRQLVKGSVHVQLGENEEEDTDGDETEETGRTRS